MKTTSLFFSAVFTLLSLITQAQFVPHEYADPEFQKFLKTKLTYVQKTGDETYDKAIADALSKYWTVSKYEMVEFKTIQANMKNPEYSFLMPTNFNIEIVHQSSNSSFTRTVTYSNMQLSLLNGNKQNIMPAHQVAFVCIDQKYDQKNYYNDLPIDDAFKRESYRIVDMIATLNKSVELVKQRHDLNPNTKTENWVFGVSITAQSCHTCELSIKYMSEDVYNRELFRIKTKTLYLLKENFGNTGSIYKDYPYKFKLVSREELAKAVAEERKDMLYLVLTHNYWGGITIIDPSTHECVGAVHIDRCTTIDGGDLKDVVKAMEKAEKAKAKGK